MLRPRPLVPASSAIPRFFKGILAFPVVWLSTACLPADSADPWPAEPAPRAVNLTSIEGPEPNDFYDNLSGAFWNARQHRLWICRNGGATGSKFWAAVPDGAGSFRIEYRAGRRGEWTGFGDLEDVTQVDLDTDVLYALIEGEERIRAYDVSTYGSAMLLGTWNVKPYLPRKGSQGAEGLAFVPDRFLAAAGFVGGGGALYTSTRGMGGLMFVGHQKGGAVYAFDLDPRSDALTFVGEYRTGYDETAALHFDRGTGRLYVWHDSDWDTLEVSDLTSTPISGGSIRRLHAVHTFDGPHHRNNEGLTLTSIDECADGRRGAFLTIDGGAGESLLWFTHYTEGCATTGAAHDQAPGKAR